VCNTEQGLLGIGLALAKGLAEVARVRQDSGTVLCPGVQVWLFVEGLVVGGHVDGLWG
jgi:hypothetical protein